MCRHASTFQGLGPFYPRLLSFLFRPSSFLLRTVKNKKREEGEGGKARRGKADKGEARDWRGKRICTGTAEQSA